MIAIDGLRLNGSDVVINDTTRLRTFDRKDLDEFFENPQVVAFDAAIDTGPLEGRTFLQLDVAKDSEDVPFLEDLSGYAEPWLSYMNMFSDRTLHPGERFFKYNSRRLFPPVIGKRRRESMFPGWLDDGGWPQTPTVLECSADEVAGFMRELEQCRKEPKTRTARCRTALQAFSRACRTFDDSWADQPDTDEMIRTIIDLTIVIEAIFVQSGERDLQKRVPERLAALLAPSDEEEPAFVNRVRKVQRVRNKIVHGDQSPTDNELLESVKDLRTWTGKSLTALLRMGGNQPHYRRRA